MKNGYAAGARPLTPRMREVLESAAAGRTITQTAIELGVAEPTVRAIRVALCARLDVPNVYAAIAAAYRAGELR